MSTTSSLLASNSISAVLGWPEFRVSKAAQVQGGVESAFGPLRGLRTWHRIF
jgi:hypothetical protein